MKGRKTRATGGVNEASEDLGKKNMRYTYQSNVNDEAEERKRGGKAVGKVGGADAKANAGRKARKSGGSANANPFSSARAGTPPKGHKVEMDG
jgi:hypothetical protein